MSSISILGGIRLLSWKELTKERNSIVGEFGTCPGTFLWPPTQVCPSGPAEFQILVMQLSAHALAHFFGRRRRWAQKWPSRVSNTSNGTFGTWPGTFFLRKRKVHWHTRLAHFLASTKRRGTKMVGNQIKY